MVPYRGGASLIGVVGEGAAYPYRSYRSSWRHLFSPLRLAQDQPLQENVALGR